MKSGLAIGIDASTQGVKALALGAEGVEALATVNFGADLPQFGAPEGFVPNARREVREADPRMWEEGVRLALRRLGERIDLSRAEALSGAAQQHGLVCTDANGQLVFPLAPIWMDTSTGEECRELDARFGASLREHTGSAAALRFTGPQARRRAKIDPEGWRRTAHVHCVASWLNTRLVGAEAPVDPASASGQNLLDLSTFDWADDIAAFTAPDLPKRLPSVAKPLSVSGTLSQGFAVGGLRAGIPVVVWSGDNPDSLLGMGGAGPGEAIVSLGTSDTVFAPMDVPRTDPSGFGNVFCGADRGYLALVCLEGALERDRIRREAGLDWDGFGAALAKDAPGNPVKDFCEGHFADLRRRTCWMLPEGAKGFSKIAATGGGAKSDGLLGLLARIFEAPVERLAATETVALGAAMRAWTLVSGESISSIQARLRRVTAVIGA